MRKKYCNGLVLKKAYLRYINNECLYIHDFMSVEKSPLERILEIDKEINLIKNDITYMKIRNGLKKINGFHQGNRIISVPSPQNTRNEIRVRRRSKRMKSIKKIYEKRLSAFEDTINSLLRERNVLETQIFG